MPTKRHGWVKHQLREGRARVIQVRPFTIQLTYDTTPYRQPLTANLNSGYLNIGVSVQSEREEVFSAEVGLDPNVSKRISDCAMYRNSRRSQKTRYRKPGHSETGKREDKLAPSIQHKLDSHLRVIALVERILPITHINLETASFDMQKLKDPNISGTDYQNGEQKDFDNLREYILFRDHGKCQNPKCRNKAKRPILQVHHLGFWKNDRSDRPGNLITLCTDCHRPENHQPGGFLYGWEPKVRSFRPETFMTSVRRKLLSATGATEVFGYQTKRNRNTLGLPKSHANDAFAITGKPDMPRAETIYYLQRRRNNRSLATFKDAKYQDKRTGKIASGQELCSGRRTRNRELNSENLRQHRGHKVRKGQTSIRQERYPFQPGDIVLAGNTKRLVIGTHCKGARVMLDAPKQSVAVKNVKLYLYGKGIRPLLRADTRAQSGTSPNSSAA